MLEESEAREYVGLWGTGGGWYGVSGLMAKQLSEQLPPMPPPISPGDYIRLRSSVTDGDEKRVAVKVTPDLVFYVVLGALGVHSATPGGVERLG